MFARTNEAAQYDDHTLRRSRLGCLAEMDKDKWLMPNIFPATVRGFQVIFYGNDHCILTCPDRLIPMPGLDNSHQGQVKPQPHLKVQRYGQQGLASKDGGCNNTERTGRGALLFILFHFCITIPMGMHPFCDRQGSPPQSFNSWSRTLLKTAAVEDVSMYLWA